MLARSKNGSDPGATDTLIGEGSRFEGNMNSRASLRIEGEIKGDIECEGDVTIGEKGVAYSNITARNAFIAGTVHGSVSTSEVLNITETGKVFGTISSKTIHIVAGALFQGTCKMDHPAEKSAAENVESIDLLKNQAKKSEKAASGE